MKIQMFKKVSNLVDNWLNDKTTEEKHFEKIYNDFLLAEDYVFCYKMIDEGYTISPKDKIKINTLIAAKLDKSEYKYFQVRDIKSLGLDIKLKGLIKTLPSIDYENIEQLIYNSSTPKTNDFFIKEINGNKGEVLKFTLKNIKEYKKLYNSAVDFFIPFLRIDSEKLEKEKLFMKKVISANIALINAGLLMPEEIQQLKESYQNLSSYIKNKTRESCKSEFFQQIGKSTIDEFIAALTIYSNKSEHTEKKKENVIRQLKSYNVRKKSLEEEIKELIIKEDYSIENLPKEIKEQIERMTNTVNTLNNEEVNNFFKERLPSILKKYFSIDEEYRISLKNVEGYNAQQLMQQSLENIEKIILAKKEDNNIDLITELSIENRKLKVKVKV